MPEVNKSYTFLCSALRTPDCHLDVYLPSFSRSKALINTCNTVKMTCIQGYCKISRNVLAMDACPFSGSYKSVSRAIIIIVPVNLLNSRMGVLSKLIEESNLKLVSYQ